MIAVDGSTGEIFVEPSAGEAGAAGGGGGGAQGGAGRVDRSGCAPPTGTRCRCWRTSAGPADVPAAVEAGAEGVGLFRTEFLFLDDSKKAPSEEKQVEAYRQVLEAFPEGRVVVRVLDAGADKPLDFLTPGRRAEPGAGCARVCGRCWTTPRCCVRS